MASPPPSSPQIPISQILETMPSDRSVVQSTEHVTESRAAHFVPTIGAWAKPLIVPKALQDPPSETLPGKSKSKSSSEIPPPQIKEDGQLRFPWAAKMDQSIRNLYRRTTPSYMEDGTPKVHIPNHVLMDGLENQKEYVIGQFYRCYTPSGGLLHAVANRIWGKKCKIFSRKLGESSYLFHIPDKSTRDWVLKRGLWHVDDYIMFVAPWTPVATLALPEITSVPVWVTLKNIPSRLYSIKAISWIASGLGEPMLTNKPWLDPSLNGEAKLMVEVELDKGFPQRIAAEDKRGNVSMIDVDYAWLPSKCNKCGKLGHKKSRCLLTCSQTQSSAQVVSVAAFDATNDLIVAAVNTATSTDSEATISLAESAITTANAAGSVYVAATVPVVTVVNVVADVGSEVVVPLEANAPATVTITASQEALPDFAICAPSDIALLGSSVETASLSSVINNDVVVGAATDRTNSPSSPVQITPDTMVTSNKDSPTSAFNKDDTSQSTFGFTPTMVNFSTSPPKAGSLANEVVQGMVFGSNQFVNIDQGVTESDFGDPSTQTTRGGRPIKPTQKVQEMQWTMVGGRGNRGRGGRNGRGTSH